MLPYETKLNALTQTPDKGVFSLEPLPSGFGHTLGNALRRILLSSLPGGAITEFKIEGVPHEFTSVPGMAEDVVAFSLNLKKVRLKIHSKQPVLLRLEQKGPATVTAGEIQKNPEVEIVNPDLVLATLGKNAKSFSVEMVAERGVGYLSSEERPSARIGWVVLDALFSPIRRVNYRVESSRVGRQTNLDRLVLEVITDKTLSPAEAVFQAAATLSEYCQLWLASGRKGEPVEGKKTVKKDKAKAPAEASTLEELGVPTRVLNVLLKAGIKTTQDLLSKDESELLKVKNLGAKSITLLNKLLKKALQ